MNRLHPMRAAALAASLALGALAPAAHAVALAATPGQQLPVAAAMPVFDGRILVRIAPGEAGAIRAEAPRGLARMRAVSPVLRGLSATQTIRSAAPAIDDGVLFPEARAVGLDRWFVLEVDPTVGYAATAARLRTILGVEYVEPGEAPLQLTVVPNDSLYTKNWGHNNTGQLPAFVPGPLIGGVPSGNYGGAPVGTVGFDSNVQGGWGSSAGFGNANSIIAILDTGVDPTHPDLVQVAGFDYFDLDADPSDTHGHGTACAGVAAGKANNTSGDAGAAGGCRIMPLRVTTSTSYFPDRLAAALAFAASNGADVASMSIGISWNKLVSDALTAADAAGVVLLASTGNGNQPSIGFPASHPKVIAVGAASPCNTRKRSSSNLALLPAGTAPDSLGASCDNETFWGSNYGVAVKDDSAAVDILGPSMLPTTDIQGAGGFTPNGYNDRFNGTSCACPYVAGVAGLLKAQHPTWTSTQVRARLMETAVDIADVQAPAGWDKYTGYGMVNAGLPDMAPYAWPGWSSAVVPRAAADAVFGSVPAPTSLNGDVPSFVTSSLGNFGEAFSGVDSWELTLDGGVSSGAIGYANHPSTGSFFLNLGQTIRGGRHVVGMIIDRDTTVTESNETNNREAHQWSFNPAAVPTSASTVVARLTPPDRNAGRADVPVSETTYDNVDAVRMVGPALGSSTEMWVMGLHASDATSDLDLRLYLPPSTATGGFTPGGQLIASTQSAGKTEWGIVHLGNFQEDDFDAASLLVSGAGQSRFESRLGGASSIFSGTTIVIPGTAFTSNMMLGVHDVLISGSGPGTVTLELTSSGPLHMALYDPALSINNRAGATQLSAQSFGVERLTRTLALGRHAVVVYRDPTEGTGPLTYSITVRRTPAELAAITPGGGYSPSGAYKDGVGSFAAAPTVLDGNVNNTRYFYNIANVGPSAAVGFDIRERIDGVQILTWAPGTFNAGVSAIATTQLRNVRGGRHTMGFEDDINAAIAEFDETNNDHAIQFVWSPLPLTLEVPVTRNTPPDRTGGWTDIPVADQKFFNTDGLRTPFLANNGNDAYWNFFAAAPRVVGHDPDLGAWQPTSTGPLNGFGNASELSGKPAGRVELIGVDVDAAPRAVDLGLLNTAGSGDVVVHSAYSRQVGADVGTFGPFTLGPDSLVTVIELVTNPGTQRQVRIENLSGNADLELSTYDRTDVTKLFGPGEAATTANLYGNGGDEVLQTTFTTTFPAVVVNKRGSADIGKTATFRIVIGTSTVDADDEALPLTVRLAPVLPNPVRAWATISFELPRESTVELSAYDVAGRRVATLASGMQPAGRHSVRWSPEGANGARLASGVYLLRLEADGVESVRRVVLTH